MKRSAAFWSPAPVSPVRPFVLSSLATLVEPGLGRHRRSSGCPRVRVSALTYGFSPNRSGVWL